MSILDRIGSLLRSEMSALSDESDPLVPDVASSTAPERVSPRRTASPLARSRMSAKQACRVLELPEDAELAHIRARYRVLVRQVHPKSVDGSEEQRQSAQLALDALTDALESLERHHIVAVQPKDAQK